VPPLDFVIPFHFTPHHFTVTAKQSYMPWPSNFLQREKTLAALQQRVMMEIQNHFTAKSTNNSIQTLVHMN
jgi:hypothetical protein